MLPSSVSHEGKPYMDDRREIRREGGNPGNCGVGRRRTNKDYKSMDDHEYRNEEVNPIP